ncbi:MAG TPA: lipid-binding SYLF domain-containing protein [Candidatus Angelobacter sp.]|nr:lipid-binding SYLF domain-containing protein [Candidatus Angelobacter sp.]
MNKKVIALAISLAMSTSLLIAQEKEDERLANSSKALEQILSGGNGLPTNVLNRALCVLVFPNVKKAALGIGQSYGRGALVCRKGATMNGEWGAPAMYSLDQSSLGLQLGGSSTDFVLVAMNQKGADQILNGKVKLGGNAAAVAGPTGAQATQYDAQAMNNKDILTYLRSKGALAGVSMEGAKIDTDKDANKALYGKDITAKEIVSGNEQVPPAAQPLVNVLDKASPARKQ